MTTQNMIATSSVWEAVTNDAGEAENLRLRSLLMSAIIERIEEFGWSQTTAARNLGVTQPRLSDLFRDKIDKFSLDALVNIACPLGITLTTVIAPPKSFRLDGSITGEGPGAIPAL